jgi:crossover junction endodeoxyribonuclease RusA
VTRISFDVLGTPVTQGSMKAFAVGRRAIVTHDKRPQLMDWRGAIASAAQDHANGQFAGKGVPVVIHAVFRLQRPKSAPKRVIYPTTKPDGDKLARSLFDALKGRLYADDSQVVKHSIEKRYAAESEAPGVVVWVDWS